MNPANITDPHPHISPYLRIRPSSGWQALDLAQVWQYRDLLFSLAARDIKLRYKQTALGVIWVILQPLMAAGIFSFVFGTVAKMPSDGVPYLPFTYAGLLGWSAFSGTLSKSSSCLVGNAHLISKIFFPRLILPLSTVLSSLLDFAIALATMGVLIIVYGIPVSSGILLLPIWLLLTLLFAIGIGLLTAAMTVTYRDVQYILPVILQFLLYVSPVAYPVSAVPEKLLWVYDLNPLASLLECFRWSLLGSGHVSLWGITYSVVCGVIVFLTGAFAFKRMERTFADLI